jgi:hypothetical protein
MIYLYLKHTFPMTVSIFTLILKNFNPVEIDF